MGAGVGVGEKFIGNCGALTSPVRGSSSGGASAKPRRSGSLLSSQGLVEQGTRARISVSSAQFFERALTLDPGDVDAPAIICRRSVPEQWARAVIDACAMALAAGS